ncbi:periplasmic heavy metal sensor [candidate division KSB1 bacterium]|nr:periplasmic heavy metal sensor [candidate division KSB1 bacterium]
MKSRIFFFAIMILTVINLAALATFAYHRIYSRYQPESCPAQELKADAFLQQKLGLSADQLEGMRKIRSQYHRQTEMIVTRLADNRMQLIQMVITPEPDVKQIEAVCSQIDSLQSLMQRMVVEHLLTQKVILTQQQQQIFSSLVMSCCSRNRNHANNCVIQNPNH